MRKPRSNSAAAAALVLMVSLVWGCGSKSSGANNNAGGSCEQHEDCLESEICDTVSSSCIAGSCGDGVIRGDEACDEGADNGVSPSTCLVDCTENTCGDNYIGGTEQCDGAALGGATCATETTLSSGALGCSDLCELDTSDCYECGDGTLQEAEVCDDTNLDGATCGGSGFDGGEMACQADCLGLDMSDCSSCGDGSCDLEDGELTSNCPDDCGWLQVDNGGSSLYAEGHTCGVKADGTVWCWGANVHGQLGDGTFDSTSIPVQSVLIDDAVRVSVGGSHTCVLRQDQSVWCWGRNTHGQLGNGTFMDATIPTEVLSSRPFVSIDMSNWMTSCGVVDDATRLQGVCWGSGRRGYVSTAASAVPLPLLPPFKRLFVGKTHGCGVHDTDPAVYCWGDNDTGQLGTGDTTDSPVPVLAIPPGSLDASELTTGSEHTCALYSDGTVNCWGRNNQGVLGTHLYFDTYVPVPVEGLTGVTGVQLSGASLHTCVLGSDQLVYCWGLNWNGQLGDGTNAVRNPSRAEPVIGLTGVIAVDAGENSVCAVTVDRRAWCWGGNDYGELGIGPATIGTNVLTPTLVIDPYE